MAKYIAPGIFENLVFSPKMNVNDKGTLELHFAGLVTEAAIAKAWEEGGSVDAVEGKFLLFPPMMYNTAKGSTVKVPKTAAEVNSDLQHMRNLLVNYAMLIGTEAAAKEAFGGIQAFLGLGIAADKIGAAFGRVNDETFAKKVYTNLVSKFVDYIKGVKDYDKTTFRHKFWRKNEKEGFAVLPRADKPYPFESMEVPSEASQIGWTKWELEAKKNDASASKRDAKTPVKQAESLFGDDATEGVKKDEKKGVDSLI